jgi:hypothetical protein
MVIKNCARPNVAAPKRAGPAPAGPVRASTPAKGRRLLFF